MAKARGITKEEGDSIKECLELMDGVVYWRVDRASNAKAGSKAGSRFGSRGSKGYMTISLNKRTYKYHRIVWDLHHSEWADSNLQIDHIDGDKLNNGIDNLRLVDARTNNTNPATYRNGNLGITNIRKREGNRTKPYHVRILINCKTLSKDFKHLADACMWKHITLASL